MRSKGSIVRLGHVKCTLSPAVVVDTFWNVSGLCPCFFLSFFFVLYGTRGYTRNVCAATNTVKATVLSRYATADRIKMAVVCLCCVIHFQFGVSLSAHRSTQTPTQTRMHNSRAQQYNSISHYVSASVCVCVNCIPDHRPQNTVCSKRPIRNARESPNHRNDPVTQSRMPETRKSGKECLCFAQLTCCQSFRDTPCEHNSCILSL